MSCFSGFKNVSFLSSVQEQQLIDTRKRESDAPAAGPAEVAAFVPGKSTEIKVCAPQQQQRSIC